jgi:hypothetical protein
MRIAYVALPEEMRCAGHVFSLTTGSASEHLRICTMVEKVWKEAIMLGDHAQMFAMVSTAKKKHVVRR